MDHVEGGLFQPRLQPCLELGRGEAQGHVGLGGEKDREETFDRGTTRGVHSRNPPAELAEGSGFGQAVLGADEGEEVDLVVRSQVLDQIVVADGRALVGGIGELGGQEEDLHSPVPTRR